MTDASDSLIITTPTIKPRPESPVKSSPRLEWMLRLDWSLSRLVTQDIKTQPQINRSFPSLTFPTVPLFSLPITPKP